MIMAKHVNKFEEEAIEVLEWNTINEYEEDPKSGTVRIEVDTEAIDFDMLQKLTVVFGTKLIDIGSSTREEGYCETCAYTQAVTTLSIRGVNFD